MMCNEHEHEQLGHLLTKQLNEMAHSIYAKVFETCHYDGFEFNKSSAWHDNACWNMALKQYDESRGTDLAKHYAIDHPNDRAKKLSIVK